MKKSRIILLTVFCLLMIPAALLAAYSVELNYRDDIEGEDPAENLTFPFIEADDNAITDEDNPHIPADQYLAITLEGLYEAEMEIYTNNFPEESPSTDEWGYQYGGMVNRPRRGRAELLWRLSNQPGRLIPGGRPGEEPSSDRFEWKYIKDKADIDIPEAEGDQSWDEAQNAGYTRVSLSTETYIFFEGNFFQAGAGEYNTVVHLDFYEITPVDPEPELESVSMEMDQSGGTLTMENGSYLQIPENSFYDEDLNDGKITITLSESTETFKAPRQAADEEPVRTYRIEPENLRLRRTAELQLYAMPTAEFRTGAAVMNNRGIKIFLRDRRFDEWELEGGEDSPLDGKLFLKGSLREFGTRAIYQTKPLTDDDFRPRKRIVTPNSEAVFQALDGQNTKIKIYDVTGREVRRIGSDDNYTWNGSDRRGNFVESGIYIYQFKVEIEGSTKLISGTLAVAK